jgi:N utilization substance protein A
MDFKTQVETLLQAALDENPSLFLIALHIGANHAIKIIIDGDTGVSLQECMRVSRAIEHNMDREEHDFSLEVTSAGVGEPLTMIRQYKKNVGRKLEVTDTEGKVYTGKLEEASEKTLSLSWKQREPKPSGKGKTTVSKTKELTYDAVSRAKIILSVLKMENLALIESFSEFKDDKLIDRVTLMVILEEVFRNTLKRKYGNDENFDIIINPDKGDLEIWRNRVVVEDGKVEDPNEEIELTEAKKIEPDFEVGEDVSEEVKLIDLGRRSIMSLRQNLVAKIFEHDSTNIFNQFKDRVGEIYTAEVHHIRSREVILLDDEGNELILPKDKQIPNDFFRKGDNVRGVIDAVELRGNKPRIILSRTSPVFLEKLFEQEIPEVFDGLITIKKAVRIPGEKAKVAVDSYDDRIDPVGACVGMKGSRIHGVVRELGNENIDVINYTNNLQLFITRSLSPAKINSLKIDEETKRVQVFLDPDEVSKAIGKGGHNIRLAGKLTGFDIDVYREGMEEDVELTEFSDEIEEWVIEEFKKVGLDTAKAVLELEVQDLLKRTDLEEETIKEVVRILKEEFED